MTNNVFKIALFIWIPFLLDSCLDYQHSGDGNDIPTKGTLEMSFDINDSFAVTQLIDQFEIDYPKADIKPRFLNYQSMMEGMQNGKITAAFLHRSFTSEEQKVLEKNKIKLRSVKLFYTSSAFITNKASNQDSFTVDDLLLWCSGESILPYQKLAIIGPHGGRIYEILDSMMKVKKLKFNRSLVLKQSPQQIIAEVKNNTGVLGVVGVNWLADRAEQIALDNKKSVKILALKKDLKHGAAYPFQSQIADKSYPFIETVWGYDLQGYSGLASGFLSYVCAQSAQIMIKKSGLYPAIPPQRTIEIQ